MNDQQQWDNAIAQLDRLLKTVGEPELNRLRELATEYRQHKERLGVIGDLVTAASDCAACQGLCCHNGKYRMNLFDAMVFRLDGETLPKPDFTQKPLCPYGSNTGCHMPPGLRPADCMVFICDTIDAKLDSNFRTELIALERAIRDCVRKAGELAGASLSSPLLLSCTP